MVPSTLVDLEDKLTSIVDKIDKMPLEAIGNDLKKDLEKPRPDADGRQQTDQRRRRRSSFPASRPLSRTCTARSSRSSVRRTTPMRRCSNRMPPRREDLRNALYEFTRAARSLRVLTDAAGTPAKLADPRQDRTERREMMSRVSVTRHRVCARPRDRLLVPSCAFLHTDRHRPTRLDAVEARGGRGSGYGAFDDRPPANRRQHGRQPGVDRRVQSLGVACCRTISCAWSPRISWRSSARRG